MAHVTRGFIADTDRLRTDLGEMDGFELVELEQCLGLVYLNGPLAVSLRAVTGMGGGRPFAELEWLEAGAAQWAHHASRRGPLAYIETNYFGGFGTQGAILWNAGEIAVPPAIHRDELSDGNIVLPDLRAMPINRVLRAMGILIVGGYDEFESIGLSGVRDLGAWTPAIY